MELIKYIIDNYQFAPMIFLMIVVGWLALENKALKNDNRLLNNDIKTILEKTTSLAEKVISSGEIHTIELKNEIKLLKERINNFIENH